MDLLCNAGDSVVGEDPSHAAPKDHYGTVPVQPWPSTQGSLLCRLRHNDDDGIAWKEFVDLYAPLVYGYCRKRDLQDADASDVTQNVFLKLSSALRRFEYSRKAGYFRGWLGTVTRNEIRRHLSKNQRDIRAIGDVISRRQLYNDDGGWSEEFNDHILRTALSRIRTEFSPEVWKAFELLWIEDRCAPDVAAEIDRDRNWLYKAKHRVIRRLEEEILLLSDDIPQLNP